MTSFIRFDVKGTFRGSEHISTFTDESFEEVGISCYEFDTDGVANLIQYWTHQLGNIHTEDYADMNLTVFAGERVGTGTDFEDCASCTEVLAEIDGAEFFNEYQQLQDRVWDEEMMEDEMYESLAATIKEAIK